MGSPAAMPVGEIRVQGECRNPTPGFARAFQAPRGKSFFLLAISA
jgi:hypothetical protein